MTNSPFILLCITEFLIFWTGFIAAYFISAYFGVLQSIEKYGNTHNMTTGCLLNVTPCKNIIKCHQPYYNHCVTEGLLGVCTALFPMITIMSIAAFVIIVIIYPWYLYYVDKQNYTTINDNEIKLIDIKALI